ncbi:uncharacterized protein LOC118279971 [Spodoptera frugiperda]|uniref:Uncharacterized protein LOC118279971 n=1 Tax=Spodoptera frugiperda TaxID=7108 RepID=A0A9R0ERN3_SPOFR|nr:uncharacterized protein LOC118279971 [Spodoptera frugiperda]
MYFGKLSIVILIVSCIMIDARKKISKAKLKKSDLQNLGIGCGCQSSIIDILTLGSRGSLIEPVYGPVSLPAPVIDVPNYRYAEAIEINPLGNLFPTLEVSNYGVAPFSVIDLPCGCSGPCGCRGPCGCGEPNCGCRVPAVKLPACAPAAIDVPKCGCASIQSPAYSYGISALIDVPSYVPACGCQAPCSCAVPKSCGCVGPCGCAGLSSCECMGPCSCGLSVPSCGCNGPCSCLGMPVAACGCSGPCSCGVPTAACGCTDVCTCGLSVLPCGCNGPCNCGSLSTCGCSGPCNCLGIQVPSYGGVLPTIEVPSCGCGCGMPGCSCNPKYLRQVTLQPPFL